MRVSQQTRLACLDWALAGLPSKLTEADAADVIGVDRRTLRRMIVRGEFPQSINGAWRKSVVRDWRANRGLFVFRISAIRKVLREI